MEYLKLTHEHIKDLYDIRFSVQENLVHSHQICYLQRELVLEDIRQGGGWICKVDNVFAGYGLGINIPQALIGGLFVRPQYQRMGIGSEILERITEWFYHNGNEQIHLTTDKHSVAARFYERKGWISQGLDAYGQLMMIKKKEPLC